MGPDPWAMVTHAAFGVALIMMCGLVMGPIGVLAAMLTCAWWAGRVGRRQPDLEWVATELFRALEEPLHADGIIRGVLAELRAAGQAETEVPYGRGARRIA